MSWESGPAASSDSLRILIAEDNEAICSLFHMWLAEQYEVDIAFDGEEALAKFDPAVDIILLDRRMPVKSGDEVLSHIRATGWDGQVIMVTAVEPSVDAIHMEFDAYLAKPIDREDLIEAIEQQRRVSEFETEVQEYLSLIAKRDAIRNSPRPIKVEDGTSGHEAFEGLLNRISLLEPRIDKGIVATGDS